MTIYLGDLAHYTIKLMNNHTPLNIGFMAAFLKEKFPELNIRLFKNPDSILEAINTELPDILALSNYIWCESVSMHVFEYYRNIKKDGITVWGGPNFPMNELHKARQFLLDTPYVDFYIPFEGETPLYNIVNAVSNYGNDIEALKSHHQDCFEGAFFVSQEGELVENKIGLQVPDLSAIPSPWLGGWMDEFLHEGLHPLFETQRGCPYLCTFCHTGLNYYNRGRSLPLDRLKEEILYIIDTVEDPRRTNMYICDANFGMWPQDLKFAQWLKEIYLKTGFPLNLGASTGKGRAAHVLKTVMSHPKLYLTNSVQSLDDKVLKGIKRRNFPLKQLRESSKEIDSSGKLSVPEVILGLPYETRESHLETLRNLIVDVGAGIIYQFTLMMLPGTEMYTDKSRLEHQFQCKYRIIPTGFGTYANRRCFEIEEVSIGSKYMSFDDYVDMRVMYFLVHNIHGNSIYRKIIKFLIHFKLDVIEFFNSLLSEQKNPDHSFPNKIINEYIRDTKNEIFDSKEAIYEYFSKDENYEELLTGTRGINITHSYRMMLLLNTKDWSHFVTNTFRKFVQNKLSDAPDNLRLADEIIKHVEAQTECQHRYFRDQGNIPTEDVPLTVGLDYDIPNMFDEDSRFVEEEKVSYSYYIRQDAIKYISHFPTEKQRLADWVVTLLRMDFQYFFPVFKRNGNIGPARRLSDGQPQFEQPLGVVGHPYEGDTGNSL